MSLSIFLQRIATIHAQTPCPKAAHEAIEAEVSACAETLRGYQSTLKLQQDVNFSCKEKNTVKVIQRGNKTMTRSEGCNVALQSI